ncbi:hypothetical protein ES332_D08G137700v1 [Gossypium tomentosum]|uniref:Uncharacterized protein n=1 Tax=Gossypium tomentosum TaxID=34277 RepID=A0A5D2JUE7_GOSTO|nr:hypothetical protein ES332_D08G137700v1 [Gossypium tomentosum]
MRNNPSLPERKKIEKKETLPTLFFQRSNRKLSASLSASPPDWGSVTTTAVVLPWSVAGVAQKGVLTPGFESRSKAKTLFKKETKNRDPLHPSRPDFSAKGKGFWRRGSGANPEF